MYEASKGSFTRDGNSAAAWTASSPWRKLGTEPNGHGTLLIVPMLSTATAQVPSCANGLIGSNVIHFDVILDVDTDGAVPCRVNEP